MDAEFLGSLVVCLLQSAFFSKLVAHDAALPTNGFNCRHRCSPQRAHDAVDLLLLISCQFVHYLLSHKKKDIFPLTISIMTIFRCSIKSGHFQAAILTVSAPDCSCQRPTVRKGANFAKCTKRWWKTHLLNAATYSWAVLNSLDDVILKNNDFSNVLLKGKGGTTSLPAMRFEHWLHKHCSGTPAPSLISVVRSNYIHTLDA